jgi:hypothetical protein
MTMGGMNPFDGFRRIQSSTSQRHLALDNSDSKTSNNEKSLNGLAKVAKGKLSIYLTAG